MNTLPPNSDLDVPPDGRLTGVDLASLPPPERIIRLQDGGGLFLELHPEGGRYWRIRFRHGRRENSMSLGVYPAVDLAGARAAASEVRALLAQGIDPSAVRKAGRIAEMAATAALRDPGHFLISQAGALVVQLPGRAFTLSPNETRELRAFLNATSTVGADCRGE